MTRFCYLIFVFVAASTRGQVTFQLHDPNACTDENGNPGDCKSLMDCPLTAEKAKRPTSADFVYFLKIKCGFDKQQNPKVCCPKSMKIISRFDEKLWPDDIACSDRIIDKIINGENTTLGQYPFMVRLSRGGHFHCGGSLINQRYVITAAHCANGVSTVRLGEWNIKQDIDCDEDRCADPAVDVAVENITIHENYITSNYSHDIALIRLAKTVNYTRWIAPVCLPHTESLQSRDLVNSLVTVTGWGYTNSTHPVRSDILMQAELTVYDRSACEKAFDVTLHNPEQICVGSTTGVDSCKGDSGGPATTLEPNIPQYHLLAGLVSIGHYQCGTLNFPAIYTNVSAYMPWIYEHVMP